MSTSFEEASQRFHNAGLRMTRPREILLQLVLTSDGPFSVKMLHERADQAGLNMHLATVHRNLAEFVEVGLVDEMPGEDNRLYALHEDQEVGAHIFCLDCRHIIVFDGFQHVAFKIGIALRIGFRHDGSLPKIGPNLKSRFFTQHLRTSLDYLLERVVARCEDLM